MNSRPLVLAARWLVTLAALAGIILVYRRWLHVNPTTVALTLVLFTLLIAARLGLRYAVRDRRDGDGELFVGWDGAPAPVARFVCTSHFC